MLKQVKEWSNNFLSNKINSDNDILFDKHEFKLKKYKDENENKHIYFITGKLKKDPSKYIKYFWNLDEIKEVNKNILDSINLINEKDKFKEIYTKFKLRGTNFSENICDKKDNLFLEKDSNNYTIYSSIDKSISDNNILGDNFIHIQDGYSIIKLTQNENNGTDVTYLIEFNAELESFKELIPGIILLKTFTNLNTL